MALRSNSNRVSIMQQPPDDPAQQSLPSIASGSLGSTVVDFPLEYDDNPNDVAEHPNVPCVFFTRTSSEPHPPQSSLILQQTLSKAHSTASLGSTVDIPVECNNSNQLQNDVAEHPNVPHVIITRTSGEPPPPQLSRARLQQTLSKAHSTMSRRSNWSMMGDYRMNFVRRLFHVSDNRLAMKLFGDRRGIRQEEERLKNCSHLLIHPCSKFR